jgi:hypothetical protein
MTQPTPEPTTLHFDQAQELRRLVGTVEDWLLHTSFEVREDLGAFLTGLGWAGAEPQQLVTWLIDALGEQTIVLRPNMTRPSTTSSPNSTTGPA